MLNLLSASFEEPDNAKNAETKEIEHTDAVIESEQQDTRAANTIDPGTTAPGPEAVENESTAVNYDNLDVSVPGKHTLVIHDGSDNTPAIVFPPEPLPPDTCRVLADEYLSAGLSIMPVTEGKRPAIRSWKPYQEHPPTREEIEEWIVNNRVMGYAAVCGKVSGNLEVIDIDDIQAKENFLRCLSGCAPELMASLLMVDTPKGGLHIYYRCETIEGNQKLACDEGSRVLIETRGEGGYVVAPGADPRVHPLNKSYQLKQGSFATIPTLTPEHRDDLLELARLFNCQIKPSRVDGQLSKDEESGDDEMRPGDDFNQRATWEEVLTPYNWKIAHQSDEETYWIRPGKCSGVSATTNYAGSDKLVVFSTSTPFETETSYSKFAAYAVLNHGGDFSKAAAELAQSGYGNSNKDSTKKKQAGLLVDLAKDVEFFNYNDQAYATLTVDKHKENYRLYSSKFEMWLSRQYYLANKTTASDQAMKEAMQTLTGKALYEGATLPVFVRVAGDRDRMYVDLADESWRVVEIDSTGWRILDQSPVKFIRPNGMKPLLAPTLNGKLSDLRTLINVQSDDDWLLLLSWLEQSLTPCGPYPVLAISGEQGSAKSTTSKMLRTLVDNNGCLLRTTPHDARDLAVMAMNSWLMAFDNLSGVNADLSDLLCSVSTGGGFSTRMLYANEEEVQFNYCRPILINGISEVLTRPDMLDRTISINLPAIDEQHRRCEEDVWKDFYAKAGGILGALLTVISQAIAIRGQVKLTQLPRMADFAVFATACEQGNGFKSGSFMAAYSANRLQAQEGVIEGSSLAEIFVEWVEQNIGIVPWDGTYKRLLADLTQRAGYQATKDKFFPRTPMGLRHAMTRLAPVLRSRGILIESLPKRRNERPIRITVQKPVANTV